MGLPRYCEAVIGREFVQQIARVIDRVATSEWLVPLQMPEIAGRDNADELAVDLLIGKDGDFRKRGTR